MVGAGLPHPAVSVLCQNYRVPMGTIGHNASVAEEPTARIRTDSDR